MSDQVTTARVWYICKTCDTDRQTFICTTREKLATHEFEYHGVPMPSNPVESMATPIVNASINDKQPEKRYLNRSTNGIVENETPAPASIKNYRKELRRLSLVPRTSGSDADISTSDSEDGSNSSKITAPIPKLKKTGPVEAQELGSDFSTQNSASVNNDTCSQESPAPTTLPLAEIATNDNNQHQCPDTRTEMQSELTPPQSVSVGNSDAIHPTLICQTHSNITAPQLRRNSANNLVARPEKPNIKRKRLAPPTSFVCGSCGKRLTTKADLVLHELRHKKPMMFMIRSPSHRCGSCPRVFYRRDHLTRHERIHSGEKPYCCKFCPVKNSRQDGIMSHIRRFHSTQLKAGVKTYTLGIGTTTSNNSFGSPAGTELSVTASARKLTLSSKPSSLMLASKNGRGRDKKVPKNVATHSRTTSRQPGSKPAKKATPMHPLTPTGSAKRGCSSRTTSGSLAVYNLTCDQCGKTFSRSDKLGIHKRSHTGEKPYGCRFCQAKFGGYDQVMNHIHGHHGEDLKTFKGKPYTLDNFRNAPPSSGVKPKKAKKNNVEDRTKHDLV